MLLGFWLILLPWMFVSSYTTIYFFVKVFFRMFIFQWIQYSNVLSNDHETQTQPIIVKFKTHSFKEKIFHQQKKLAKVIKISPSLTKRRSDILQQVQHIIKEESSDDSPNEEGIVKFALADVHGTLKIVLTKSYKNRHVFAFDSVLEYFQIVNKVSTKETYPYEGEFED